jgi:hypothetical protein
MAFNTGSKVYICETAQSSGLDQSGFEALEWIETPNVGTLPDVGRAQDELTYPTLADGVQKGKGPVNYGSGDFDVSREGTNLGRDAFAAAALTELDYAVKIVGPDAVSGVTTASIDYLRGKIAGPVVPGGGPDQKKLHRFSYYITQHLPVAPEAVGS